MPAGACCAIDEVDVAAHQGADLLVDQGDRTLDLDHRGVPALLLEQARGRLPFDAKCRRRGVGLPECVAVAGHAEHDHGNQRSHDPLA
jgi:hypothetical protein